MKKLLTIIKNTISSMSFNVVFFKIIHRILNKQGSLNKQQNLSWIKKNCIDSDFFLKQINSEQYYNSTKTYKSFLKNISINLSEEQKQRIGGGGMYVLLNFLVSYYKPKNLLETGVALGVSSHAILQALINNNSGHLYSSDFPIMRLKDPFKFIGILVDEKLRCNWSLYLEGDKKNLIKICSKIDKVDLIHYDSEKRYHGRKYVFNFLDNLINKDTIIVMDDIQDNSFFYDYVILKNIKNYSLFKYENKYVGLIMNSENNLE